MKSGWVAVIGQPNVGKSSLMNSILGTKLSITSPKAQTTRDRVRYFLTKSDYQIGFVDTPGFYEGVDQGLSQYMRYQTQQAFQNIDLAWVVIDPFFDIAGVEKLLALLKKRNLPRLWVAQKSDLTKHWNDKKHLLMPLLASEKLFFVSALQNKGLETLESATVTYLSQKEYLQEDTNLLSDKPMRYFVQEIIREKLYYCLGQELPYACAVQVESFQELGHICKIQAIIYTARDSQRGIVVGKDAAKIKEIGSKARLDIEILLGTPVYLGLHVKVKHNWMKQPDALKALGYGDYK